MLVPKTFLKIIKESESQFCDTVKEFFRNELPSIDKVLKGFSDDPLLQSFKRTTFYKLLKILYFIFKTRGRNSLLLVKNKIV